MWLLVTESRILSEAKTGLVQEQVSLGDMPTIEAGG